MTYFDPARRVTDPMLDKAPTSKPLTKKELDKKLDQILSGHVDELKSLSLDELKQVESHIDARITQSQSKITRIFNKSKIDSLQRAKSKLTAEVKLKEGELSGKLVKSNLEQTLIKGHNETIEELKKNIPPHLRDKFLERFDECKLNSHDQEDFLKAQKKLSELTKEFSHALTLESAVTPKTTLAELRKEFQHIEAQIKKGDFEDDMDEGRREKVSELLNKTSLEPEEVKMVNDYLNFMTELLAKNGDEQIGTGRYFSQKSAVANYSETKEMNKGGYGIINQGEVIQFNDSEGTSATTIARIPFVVKSDLEAESGATHEEVVAYATFFRSLSPEQQKHFPIYIGSTIPQEQLEDPEKIKEFQVIKGAKILTQDEISGAIQPQEVHMFMEKFLGNVEQLKNNTILSHQQKDKIAEGAMAAYEDVLSKEYYLGDLKDANILFKTNRGALCDFQTLFNFGDLMRNITKEGVDEFIKKANTWSYGSEIAINEINSAKERLQKIRNEFDSKTPLQLETELRAIYDEFAKIGKFCVGVALYRMYADYPPCEFTNGGINPKRPLRDWDKKLLDSDGKLSPERQKIKEWIELIIKPYNPSNDLNLQSSVSSTRGALAISLLEEEEMRKADDR